MGYVDEHLMEGERVVHRARLHWIVFVGPLPVAVLAALIALGLMTEYPGLGGIILLMAALVVIGPYIQYITSEFAVTDRRVIIKVGWIRRHTLETLLTKVENIAVDQGILGRIMNYGTIHVTGTGGTKESFPRIADPMEFRRQVQGQTTEAQDRSSGTVPVAEPVGDRQERECPHCAEPILAKARVCKHCGREVEPLSA
jgi:uncharacterized membrane protein YdbT with pleckstrin-like domain